MHEVHCNSSTWGPQLEELFGVGGEGHMKFIEYMISYNKQFRIIHEFICHKMSGNNLPLDDLPQHHPLLQLHHPLHPNLHLQFDLNCGTRI